MEQADTDQAHMAELPPLAIESAPHSACRARLIEALNSHQEIVPAADSPLGKLWRLVHSDLSTIEQCVEVIALDPALTARVFRTANSTAYGGKVSTLKEAVFFLGFAKLREVVFSAGIFHQLRTLKLPPKWTHFWIRNIFIARLAEKISSDCFRPAGTEYLAGLLHDVGWLFLLSAFPDEVEAILQSPLPLPEAEREILSFSHADVSALLCARSHLPPQVVAAVRQHQHFDPTPWPQGVSGRGDARFLSVVLRLCDQLANSCQMLLLEEDPHTLERIESSPEALWLQAAGIHLDFRALVEEELTKSQEVFSIFFIRCFTALG